MPTYEWKHKDGTIVEVDRRMAESDIGPRKSEVPKGYTARGWKRIISRTTTPFEHLKDRGVFERTHWKPDRRI